MPDFLLEIGCEELPAAVCSAAIAQLDTKGRALLEARRLAFRSSRALGTPRRLAWLVEDLAARQEDRAEWVRGPSLKAAYDGEGRPTKAAKGFAAAQGVRVEDLDRRETHVYARRVESARAAADVLAEAVPALVGQLEFPKTMRWGDGEFRFARPIRWLVALLGGEVVPCEVAGTVAGRRTSGHRTLHPEPVELDEPAAYERMLAASAVVVDPAERRQRIWQGATEVAGEAGGEPLRSEELLDEVNFLVEWPTAFAGRFSPAALELPEAVLVTVMHVHQRYFPVRGADGRLLPAFVGVRNGGREDIDTVVAGNEKVLRARLADARFFYDEDRSTRLADRVDGLASVAFAPGLGNMRQKAERLAALDGGEGAAARAARLCKADRLTHLVYEFPELEGLMGGHYAGLDGEPGEVAAAIGEHVLPRAAGDELPRTPLGRRLALADRFDNLAGHFALGRAPTGSADPFGLRRQALAVLRILHHAGDGRPLRALVSGAVEAYAAVGPALPADPTEDVVAFLLARLEGLMVESGCRYDVARAVLARGGERAVPDLWRLAETLGRCLERPEFEDVLTACRRAANLAQKAEGGKVRPDLFEHAAEGDLLTAVEDSRALQALAASPADFDGFYRAAGQLRAPVDAFLEAVLVMAPDPAVRANRLNLLRQVADLISAPADLGQIAGS